MNDFSQIKGVMRAVIVLPYLNEQNNLKETCYSLGFGLGTKNTPVQTLLILVDNGSADRSFEIAREIQSASLKESVVLEYESERGYVPARHRGNLAALCIAEEKEWNTASIMILQADADTVYDQNYVESMRLAARENASNALFEGYVSYPSEFLRLHHKYIEMLRKVDFDINHLFAPEADDMIVDDKVTGYLLSDYFIWGGHKREYNTNGEEIYAETTRLYLKAITHGARRIRVDNAYAYHSARKLFYEPALQFASAGFPRGLRWKQQWQSEYKGPATLTEFYDNPLNTQVLKAISLRQQHLIALLVLLPYQVKLALNGYLDSIFDEDRTVTFIKSIIPKRTINELRDNPGKFIADMLDIVDNYGDQLLRIEKFM